MEMPLPLAICRECLENGPQEWKDKAGHVKGYTCYCEHNQSGAFMNMLNGKPMGLWVIYSPISIQEFNNAVAGTVMGKIKHFKGWN